MILPIIITILQTARPVYTAIRDEDKRQEEIEKNSGYVYIEVEHQEREKNHD